MSDEYFATHSRRLVQDDQYGGKLVRNFLFIALLGLAACDSAPEPIAKIDASPVAMARERSAAVAGASPGGLCMVKAFSKDLDPNGLNVRKSPSVDAEIVGKLPRWKAPDLGPDSRSTINAPMFTVVEVRDGWARINGVEIAGGTNSADTASADYAASPIEGWISSKMVGFAPQTQVGFARPDPASAIVLADRSGLDSIPIRPGLLGCAGEWLQVEFATKPSAKRAWIRGICGDPSTTCDGVEGDVAPQT